MPSITTHYIQSEEVYKKLNKEEKEHIKDNKTIFNIFTQSHDILFYSIFNKKISNLGHYAHHHETQNYLLNIIKEIKTRKLESNPEIMAYLYGVITHYSTDIICHPYIFYKTGVYRKHQKWTHKYRGEHNHIEKEIDAYYYEKYFHQKYNRCNLNKEIIKKPEFSNNLIDLISKVYKKTYNEDEIGKIYYKCISYCKIVNTIVVHDFFGIKKCIYMLIDLIARRRIGFITSYSNHIMKPKKSWLNEEHNEWNHPCYKEKKFHFSFDDLFNQSIEKSINIIKEVNKYLYGNGNLNSLKTIIPNDDYATGITCDDPHTLEYFEY